MNFENLIVETGNSIANIIINRPSKLNALNKATISELSTALQDLGKNKDVRVIILTGSGEKSFVAGADISEFSTFNKEQGKQLAALGQETLFNLIENLNKPVVAAINGFALGGGLELAMACHIRIASSNAKLGLPEVTLGLIPGYGGTQRLAQLVGRGKANEMIFSAAMITADVALDWGLVNEVVEGDQLMQKAHDLATKISLNSPLAIEAAIRSVNAGFAASQSGLNQEIEEFGNLFGTPDFNEGVSAFLEKRKPKF